MTHGIVELAGYPGRKTHIANPESHGNALCGRRVVGPGHWYDVILINDLVQAEMCKRCLRIHREGWR